MIKHIVMWRLREDIDKKAAAEAIKRELEALVSVIPELKSARVGINFNNTDTVSDIVLETEFLSKDDLDTYQAHPAHKRVGAEFVRPNVSERRVCDYEY